VFRNFIDEASKAMSRSRDLLAQGNPRANPTQRQQARAQSLLEQLEKAFDDSDDPTRQGGGGGGGGQGGAGQQDQELLRRMAEVRLLRSMQRMIRAQTQSIDDARSSETPLTPDQQEDVKDTAESQRSARQMADRLTQALQRYRNLQQRVQQAGKHMAEAQRGLERQNTGEAVQEHESQAIVRLNEALTRMQQRAQQQQQQQQRQQQQRQAGQMPQGGQPQTGQQQQGGSQPAMRSLARRTGVQSGALGTLGPDARGFGGLDSRGLDALRSGAREKGPAEFQDLIRRYYSGLTERGR
jgi:hypothetical protein